MQKKLTRVEAFRYVYDYSEGIRNWYKTEHGFNPDSVIAYNCRTFGYGSPGDIVSEIIADGLKNAIIAIDPDETIFERYVVIS